MRGQPDRVVAVGDARRRKRERLCARRFVLGEERCDDCARGVEQLACHRRGEAQHVADRRRGHERSVDRCRARTQLRQRQRRDLRTERSRRGPHERAGRDCPRIRGGRRAPRVPRPVDGRPGARAGAHHLAGRIRNRHRPRQRLAQSPHEADRPTYRTRHDR